MLLGAPLAERRLKGIPSPHAPPRNKLKTLAVFFLLPHLLSFSSFGLVLYIKKRVTEMYRVPNLQFCSACSSGVTFPPKYP